MNIRRLDMIMGSVPETATISPPPAPPSPPHMYPEELQLKLYQAFIFSIPILFSIILFLLFYLFYLKRRASSLSSSPHLLPRRTNIPPITYRYHSSPCRLDLAVQFLDKLPRILFDEALQARDSMPTFIQICKKGSVEQYSAVPYLATLINCLVWTLYGLPMVHPHSVLVVTINGAGCVIEVIYLTLFIIYSDRKKRLKVFLGVLLELIFIALLAFLSLTMIHTVNKRSVVVGTICMLFNVAMYASPLSVMKLVITTKSVEYMPFFLSLASFGNGVSWTTYALIPFDPFIAIPNGIGTLFAVAQLILYATYYKSTKEQIAARNEKGEMNLSEVVVGNGGQDINNKKISAAPNGI